MKIKDKININDLYFGIKLYPMSWTRGEKQDLVTYNLFDFSKVKHAVATWVLMDEYDRREQVRDPLMWCFSGVRSRAEFEFIVCPWGGASEEDKTLDVGVKKDTFSMYVEPNRELLMDLVNRVTKTSAQKYLRDWRKEHKR